MREKSTAKDFLCPLGNSELDQLRVYFLQLGISLYKMEP